MVASLERPIVVTMANVTVTCENPECGKSFVAQRSDARFCGNRCRQAAHRRSKDPMVASSGQGAARHRRTQVESLGRVLDKISLSLRSSTGMIDYPKTLSAPEAPLAEWEEQITDSIRFLAQVRRGIRDQQARNG